jgi:hypothetical protein
MITLGSVIIKALRYKSESHRFESHEINEAFSVYLILLAAQCSGVYSASNRN